MRGEEVGHIVHVSVEDHPAAIGGVVLRDYKRQKAVGKHPICLKLRGKSNSLVAVVAPYLRQHRILWPSWQSSISRYYSGSESTTSVGSDMTLLRQLQSAVTSSINENDAADPMHVSIRRVRPCG